LLPLFVAAARADVAFQDGGGTSATADEHSKTWAATKKNRDDGFRAPATPSRLLPTWALYDADLG
jgi:hypothetical protein